MNDRLVWVVLTAGDRDNIHMTYAPKILLHSPFADPTKASAFVEDCLRDGVCLIAIVGDQCAETEDLIDSLIVRDGADESRFIVTTSHPDEPLDEVLEFARWWSEAEGEGQQIRL
jgi:hypothetical protein